MTYINTVETSPLSTAGSQPWDEPVAVSLHARALQLLAAQEARLERVEVIVEQELQRLEEELADQRDQSDRFRGERDALATQPAYSEASLAEGQQRPADAPDDGRTPGDDYRRRYELALNDLHDLKARNAELQQQVDDANSTAASVAAQDRASSGRLDWEAEKCRTLAALDADFDEHDAPQCGERVKIEEVLHTTEQVIAEKDRQIQELTQRLEEQRGNIAAAPPDTAAVDQVLDSDAVIREERERLKQLQEECREKLRQAEIEIALERAKLARQRAETEERLHAPESDSPTPPTTAGATRGVERPASGRWLARLGLTEADKERRRH